MQKNLQAEADYLAIRGSDRLTGFYASLDRVANRWVLGNGTPRPLWEGDAQAYMSAYPFITALEWLDPQARLQWVVPYEENKNLIGASLDTEGTRAETIQRAISTRTPQITKAVTLIQGGKGFLYVNPLYVQDRFDGFIVTAFRLDVIFNKILSNNKNGLFYVIIREDNDIVFSNLPEGATLDPEWQKSSQINNKGNTWTLTVAPMPEMLAARSTALPTLILIMGLFTTFFAVLAVFLGDKWRNNAAVLRISEEQFRLAIEHAPIGMALVAPSGRWIRVNQAVCDLVGYTQEELKKIDFQSITHPDDLEADLELARKLLNDEIQTYQLDKRYVRITVEELLMSILIVDDDATIRDLAVMLLTQAGFGQLDTAESGTDALKLLGIGGEKPGKKPHHG